jgi:predicted nuclease of predicted toxin-antitoxin system
MKLVVDMNLSIDWIPALRAAGIEAVHWIEIGPQDADNAEIMAWAQANGSVVLTRDLGFAAALTMQGLASPSIVQLRIAQVRPERHIHLVRHALMRYGAHLEQGAVVTLEEERTRVRVLNSDTNS